VRVYEFTYKATVFHCRLIYFSAFYLGPETSPENDLTGRSWVIRNGLFYAKPLHLLNKYNSELGKPRQFKVNKPF